MCESYIGKPIGTRAVPQPVVNAWEIPMLLPCLQGTIVRADDRVFVMLPYQAGSGSLPPAVCEALNQGSATSCTDQPPSSTECLLPELGGIGQQGWQAASTAGPRQHPNGEEQQPEQQAQRHYEQQQTQQQGAHFGDSTAAQGTEGAAAARQAAREQTEKAGAVDWKGQARKWLHRSREAMHHR